MTRAIYFDCFSGASGDMLLGAIVDCGLPIESIAAELRGLPLTGYGLTATPVLRAGMAATKVDVIVDDGDQPHRHLSDIRSIIQRAGLPAQDQERVDEVFTVLAEVEAQVHGTGVEEVEFHEVGAVDSIVDVVGTIAGLRLLGVDQIYVSALPAGAGEARTAHGIIPIPGPATLALLARARAPIIAPREGDRFELITPTGAALLTVLGRFERPEMILQRIGYGAGGRDTPGRPNILRAWLGDLAEPATRPVRTMIVVETNIDDMNPELYGWVIEKLFDAGAVDAWCTPIAMKKNRPAVTLQALCAPESEATVVQTILRETTTLGVRVREVRRHEAPRSSLTFESSLGTVRVKVKQLADEAPHLAPEFDDCRAIALRTGKPLQEVYRIIAAEAEGHLPRA